MPRHFDSEHKRQSMTARIYKPAKTAMQSGTGKTKEWVLDYEPEQPREIEPLMGWTSSGDMRQQVHLRFDTVEEATAYCERHGIAYQIFRFQAAGAPDHVLRRQFRLQAPRSLDALTAISAIVTGYHPACRRDDVPSGAPAIVSQ